MPATSGPMYRAMAAAKAGHSTLGIPASVGKEFVDATPPEKRSAWAHKPEERKKRAQKAFGK
jgi:hypothetical protein